MALTGSIQYTMFANHAANFRPIDKIYLNAGEEISGSIIWIYESHWANMPATMPEQVTNGYFRVDAYPVDDNNQRLANGNLAKFIAVVPIPEGFIPRDGLYNCPCTVSQECGSQTQGHWYYEH